jgi:putative endonuclease
MSSTLLRRYYIYIVGSLNGTLYIGITSDLSTRIREHKNHTFAGFTAKYEVNRLLFYEIYEQVADAIHRE